MPTFDKKQMDAMVNRFLMWKLPPTFGPDCFVSFDREKAKSNQSWPVGTNLFSADEARAMLEHVLDVTFIPDWSLLEATQASLREHMAMVKELRTQLAARGVTGADALRDAVVRAAQKWGDTDAAGAIEMLAAELELSNALVALEAAHKVGVASGATEDAPADNWRPIKSAPRDGSNILLRFGVDGVSQGKFVLGGVTHPWKFIDTNDGITWLVNHAVDGPGGPSDWQPLPSAIRPARGGWC
jgi:hypothetical protein